MIDNRSLELALQESQQVVLVFIFDPTQTSTVNKYLSYNAIQFMLESLKNLSEDIKKAHGKLYLLQGYCDKVISNLISELKIEAIFVGNDYTPFSIKRDQLIKQVCDKFKIDFRACEDALLVNPQSLKTISGENYKVFTAFYKKAVNLPVNIPELSFIKVKGCFYEGHVSNLVELEMIYKKILPNINQNIAELGGRNSAINILSKINNFKKYDTEKDFPAICTTNLSAHLKFGTVSVREVFYVIAKKMGYDHPLLRQLYWRDFFTYIVYHNPLVFGNAFNAKFRKIVWQDDNRNFKLWCEGKTGFPIVDAGMRQLNETGFMHNRVRMVTASFLVKDLHIDWQMGERYFATKLVDYDPAVNNGNWQWVAGTGCDSQPYFRVFNPWLQQKKFDPECIYIKQWVPELQALSSKFIHNWYKQQLKSIDYPLPIVDHATAAKYAITMYR